MFRPNRRQVEPPRSSSSTGGGRGAERGQLLNDKTHALGEIETVVDCEIRRRTWTIFVRLWGGVGGGWLVGSRSDCGVVWCDIELVVMVCSGVGCARPG